jgi:hypothetical protein
MNERKKIPVVVLGDADRTKLTVMTKAILALSELTDCLKRAEVKDAELGPATWMLPLEQRPEASRYLYGTFADLVFREPQSRDSLALAQTKVRAEFERSGFEVSIPDSA